MRTILLKNATIADGTGAELYSSDILIRDGIIASISKDIIDEDAHVIDVSGYITAPGFLDIHTHNDLQIARKPQRDSALSQGITTEFIGLCGLGVAPLVGDKAEEIINLYSGILGSFDPELHNHIDFDDYLDRLNGSAVNVACAVTHGAIRAEIMGFSSGIATEHERHDMAELVASCIRKGAVGFSTGLTYYPAGFSDTQELIDICHAIKREDGIFMVHKRDNFGYPRDAGDQEIIDIIRETHVKTHMLHYRTSLDNAGQLEEILTPYQEIINDPNYDVTFEFYPYPVGAGFGEVFLPEWVMDGGFKKTMEYLGDLSIRDKIKTDMVSKYSFLMPSTGAIFAALKHTKEYEGLTFAEVARMRNQDELTMITELLFENELEFGYYYNFNPEEASLKELHNDFMNMLDKPYYTVGSDSIEYGTYPHPRSAGTFTSILRLTREHNFPIEKAIHKITQFSARRFGIKNKGSIEVGMDADITVFDYDTITDNATFDSSTQLSTGVKLVINNGEIQLNDGQFTGILAGKVLKK